MKQDKKIVAGLIGAAVVVLLAAAGGWYYMRSEGREVAPLPAEQPIPPPVAVPPEPTAPQPMPPGVAEPQTKPAPSTPAPKPPPAEPTTQPKPSQPPKPTPPNPSQVIQSGIAALNSKDYTTAATQFRKARQLQPNNPDLGYLLGMSLESSGELASASDAFETCTSGPYAQIAKGHVKTIMQKLNKRR